MAEELDEFGIPIRKATPTAQDTDEFGIPIKKKSPSLPESSGTSKTSEIGGLTDQRSLVSGNKAPEIPTVLVGEAKKQAQEVVDKRKASLNKAVEAYKSTHGGKLPDTKKKDTGGTGGVGTSLGIGAAKFNEGVFKIPRYIYDLASAPQNIIAEISGHPEFKADYDYIAKGKANPLGILDRLGDWAKGEGEILEGEMPKYQKGVSESLKDGNYALAGEQVLNNIAQSVPSIIGMYVTGGAGNAANLGRVGKTMLTALPFASQRNSELQERTDIPEYIKPLNATLNGLAEVVFEQEFGTKAILDNVLGTFEREGRDAAVAAAKDFTSSYITKAIKKVQPVTSTLKNSIEEMSTQFSQNLIDKNTIDPGRDLMDGVIDAGIIGGATGAGVSTIGGASAGIFNSKQRSKLTDIVNQRNGIVNDLDNEALPEGAKAELLNQLEKVNDRISKLSDEAEAKVNTLPEKERTEAQEIQTEISEIESALQDKSLSESTRELLTKKSESLQDKLDVLVETSDIITKETEQLIIEQPTEEGGTDAISQQATNEVSAQPEATDSSPLEGGIPEQSPEESTIEATPEEVQGDQKEEEVAPESDLVDYSDATPETGKITKSAIEESREQLGLPQIEVDATRKDAEVKADADELIKSGKVFNVIDDIIAGKQKSVLDKEVNAMVGVLAEKNTQLAKANGKLMNAVRDGNQRAIDSAVIEKNVLVKEIADIQTAGRLAGREAGRTLRQFQISRVQDNSLSGFIETALRNNDNKALTPEQLKTAEEAHSKFESLWNESQAKIAELEAQMAKLEEDYAILRLKKQNDTERTRQRRSLNNEERLKQIKQERKVIIDDIFKIAKKQRSNLSANPFTAEYIKPLAQLAKNYIEEGVVQLDDLVSKIHNDLKDGIDGLTERDIRDAISGYGREASMTKDGLRLQVEELKTQARLISAIEDAEAKVKRSIGTKKKEASERVKELRQALKSLTGNDIGVASLKTRLKDRINELNKRISDGDYVKPDKHVLELDEEAKRLRDEALRVKREYEIGTEKYKLANRTKTEKTIDTISNLVGLTKSLKATWDLSAPFRQGIVASVNHPIIASRAIWDMHQAAGSEKFYERWRNDLEASPAYKLMEDSGLSLTTNKSAKVLAKEEDFSTTLSEKVPFVRGSERAYSFYLNYLRANIFIDAANELQSPETGYTFDSHPEEFKSLARVINNETGRGGLGSLEKHSSLAGNVLWSPRLMASRINLFTSIFDPSYTPRARQKAAIDLLRFIGAVSGVLFLASANDDWDIEWNPLSSNFGKIKRGDTRYSVMGGMESYITFMARMLSGLTKDSKGKIKELGGDKFGSRSRGDIAETFFRGKANPIAGIVANLAYGKDVVGNTYEPWDVADEAIPLVLPEMMDAYNAGGLGEVIKTIPATTYGIGVSRYSDKKKPKDKQGFVETGVKAVTKRLGL